MKQPEHPLERPFGTILEMWMFSGDVQIIQYRFLFYLFFLIQKLHTFIVHTITFMQYQVWDFNSLSKLGKPAFLNIFYILRKKNEGPQRK